MLKVASLFSQILGEISRIDFQKLVIRDSVPGPSLFQCSFVILQGLIRSAKYATVFPVATESLFLWV